VPYFVDVIDGYCDRLAGGQVQSVGVEHGRGRVVLQVHADAGRLSKARNGLVCLGIDQDVQRAFGTCDQSRLAQVGNRPGRVTIVPSDGDTE